MLDKAIDTKRWLVSLRYKLLEDIDIARDCRDTRTVVRLLEKERSVTDAIQRETRKQDLSRFVVDCVIHGKLVSVN